MTGSPVFSVNFTNQKFQLTYYYPIMSRPCNQLIVGFLYHDFVGSECFDVHDYFHDLFVGGKFYQFFPIDAAFYD